MSKNKSNSNPAKHVDIENLFKNLKEKDKLTSSVATKPQNVDEVANKWVLNNKIMELFADKIKDDGELKGKYALALIIILIIQLLLLNIWFVLKGAGVLTLSDSTFNIFITGGLAEIFVLIRLIVKYLFNDNLTELLKLVIRMSNLEKNKKNKKQ